MASRQSVLAAVLSTILCNTMLIPGATAWEPPVPPDSEKTRIASAKYIEGKISLVYATDDPNVYLMLDTPNPPILYYRIERGTTAASRMFATAQIAIEQHSTIGIYYNPTQSNTAEAIHLLFKPAIAAAPSRNVKVDSITTQKLEIVDANGNLRGGWSGDESISSLFMYNPQGSPVVQFLVERERTLLALKTTDASHGAALLAQNEDDQPHSAHLAVFKRRDDHTESARLEMGNHADLHELLTRQSRPGR